MQRSFSAFRGNWKALVRGHGCRVAYGFTRVQSMGMQVVVAPVSESAAE